MKTKQVEVTTKSPDPTPEEQLQGKAKVLWAKIKNLKVEMFALPEQYVNKYCAPLPIVEDQLYLSYKVTSFLPSLEEAIKKSYGNSITVELEDRYLVVKAK